MCLTTLMSPWVGGGLLPESELDVPPHPVRMAAAESRSAKQSQRMFRRTETNPRIGFPPGEAARQIRTRARGQGCRWKGRMGGAMRGTKLRGRKPSFWLHARRRRED